MMMTVSFQPLRTSLCGNQRKTSKEFNCRDTPATCKKTGEERVLKNRTALQLMRAKLEGNIGHMNPNFSFGDARREATATPSLLGRRRRRNTATKHPTSPYSFTAFARLNHGRTRQMTTQFPFTTPPLFTIQLVSNSHIVFWERLELAVPLCQSASPRSDLKILNGSRPRPEIPPCTLDRLNQGRKRRASRRLLCALIWCDRRARSLPNCPSHWSQLKLGRAGTRAGCEGIVCRRRSTNFRWHADTSCFQAFGCSSHNLSKSGRPSTSASQIIFPGSAGIGLQERQQRGSGVHQQCCRTQSLHADRFLKVENA